MKIGVFGCSWSSGVSGKMIKEYNFEQVDNVSWPLELAKIRPDWKIYNYSRGGISNTAIMYLFEKYSHLYDLNIVKMTGMARNTIIHPELTNFELTKETYNIENYHDIPYREREKFFLFNLTEFKRNYISTIFENDLDNFEIAWNMWEKYYNIDYAKYVNRAQYNYLKDKADIIFAHMKWQTDQYGFEMINTENNIENFYDYVFDDGHHLTRDGCYQEALWIERMIKDVDIRK